jgi:hypothetical protein
MGLLRRLHNLLGVTREVTHGRVDLGKGNVKGHEWIIACR